MLSSARSASALAFGTIALVSSAAIRLHVARTGARAVAASACCGGDASNADAPVSSGAGAAAAGTTAGAGAGAGAGATAAGSAPPRARKCAATVTFGVVEGQFRGDGAMDPPIVHDDPYFWLRDETRKNEEVLDHLRAENAYTQAAMGPLEGLKEKLYNEQRSHVQETDMTAPYRHGPFEYYTRTFEGKSYPVYCRRPLGDTTGEHEQVLVDGNKEAEGLAHCDIIEVQPSPDHTILAYAVDTTGDEVYTIKFLDLATGKLLADELTNHSCGFTWGKDSTELFYLTLDDAHRPDKALRHVMGTAQADDAVLVEERDELYWLGIHKTNSGRFVVVHADSETTSQVHMIDLDASDRRAAVVQPKVDGLIYSVDHHGDNFLIVNNGDGSKEFRLSITPVSSPSLDNWEDVMPYNPSTRITGVYPFANFVVVSGRSGGISRLWAMHLHTDGKPDVETKHQIAFDDPLYAVEVSGENMEFDAKVVRVDYSSLTRPPSVMDYNPAARTLSLVKQRPCPGYSPKDYTCRRIMVTVRDGTQVPVSLVYKTSTWPKGDAPPPKPLPLHLYGYGSYGVCIEPSFDSSRLCYLDRGMVYAIAHIRGGGEMGRAWYEDHGKFLKKMNTFTDHVDCAQYLVDNGITAADRMSTEGRSAGGLLMGAVLNMAPQLFKAAVAGVPFVDVLNTMCDPTLPLTVTEWLEWGNPNVRKWYDYMKQYSPYDNVTAQAYPAMLVTAGLHDHRVSYWEPAKWVSKLRELKTDDNQILFKVDLSSGHFSASDRYRYMREKAVDQAFVLWQLGLEPPAEA